MPKIIAVIPAHNEEKTIGKVILQTEKYVDGIIVCDDGSTDYTHELAERLGAKVTAHERNMGYGCALKTLFREAQKNGSEIVVLLDGDGQHDPNEIPSLILPIHEGIADVVTGSRFLGTSDIKAYRKFGVKALSKVASKASGWSFSDSECGFRAFSRKALDVLCLVEDDLGICAEILVQAVDKGLKVVEVPVTVHYGGLNTSGKNPVGHGLNVLGSIMRVVVERKPLTYFGVPSIFFLLFGIYFAVWALKIYSEFKVLVTNIVLIAFTSILVGLFFMFTAMVLYSLSRIRQEIRR